MSLSKKTIDYINQNCRCSLTGKTVLITGANSGIGFLTAETMVFLGAKVIMACRNLQKGLCAKEQLQKDYPNADIDVTLLDMADFSSIDSFVEQLPDLDVFVNNAGVFHHPEEKTKNGFDMVMGTNYLGVYYLSEKVLPKLRLCGHEVVYVNTTSLVHKIAHINYRRFEKSRGDYFRSKLCLTRYTNALVERYSGSNIHIYMTHPGIAPTNIASHLFGAIYGLSKYVMLNSAEKSSLSLAWLLSHNVPDGSIVGPCRGFGAWGYPNINRPCKRANSDVNQLIEFTETEIQKAIR